MTANASPAVLAPVDVARFGVNGDRMCRYEQGGWVAFADYARLADELAAARKEVARIASHLPGPYYMDPPDGGSVTVAEQVERMAADAARYRWLRNDAPDADPGTPSVVFGASMNKMLEGPWLDAAIDAALQEPRNG